MTPNLPQLKEGTDREGAMPYTRLSVFSALLVLYLAAPAGAAEYRLDPAHSFVQFRIPHLGFSVLVGRFNHVEGKFTFAPNKGPEAQSVQVNIRTASIDTNHAERDKHLRGTDFLHVNRYPQATFVSTGYEGNASSGVMKGNLAMHGVTKPIAIKVEKVGEGPDPWGGYRAGFKGTVTLTRADFGITYNLGPAARTVEMSLFIEGIRQ